jgi:hypothetical protein
MNSCLRDAGIASVLRDVNSGQEDLNIENTVPYAMAFGDGNSGYSPGAGVSSEDQQRVALAGVAEIVRRYDPGAADSMVGVDTSAASPLPAPQPGFADPVYLVIGDEDHTDTFVACLKETRYTGAVVGIDPSEELRQKRFSLEATVRWADCARENGFPNVKDPPNPRADGYVTESRALLPVTITEPALRSLLDKCPAFDPEGTRELEAAIAAVGGNPEPQEFEDLARRYPTGIEPQIGFDAPVWDGQNGDATDLSDDETARLSALFLILAEARESYYRSAPVPE